MQLPVVAAACCSISVLTRRSSRWEVMTQFVYIAKSIANAPPAAWMVSLLFSAPGQETPDTRHLKPVLLTPARPATASEKKLSATSYLESRRSLFADS